MSDCVICLSPPPRRSTRGDGRGFSEGVYCCAGHLICTTCLDPFVLHAVEQLGECQELAKKAEAAEAAQDARRLGELAGRICCPAEACRSEPLVESALAQLISSETFEAYIKGRALLPIAQAKACVLAEAQEALQAQQSQSAAESERQLLAIQLRAELPQARMCARCSFGPVDAFGCLDLSGHHGEPIGGADRAVSRIDNGCPSCGWFAPSLQEWPMWDGVVREAATEGEEARGDHAAELEAYRDAQEARWLQPAAWT